MTAITSIAWERKKTKNNMHFAAASILICRLENKCGISFGVILRSVVARKNLPILPTANSC